MINKFSLRHFCLSLLFLMMNFSAALPAAGRNDAKNTPSRILFLLHRGQIPESIDLYRSYAESLGRPDYHVLQQIGLSLLDIGATSDCPETQLMAIFGAGVAANDRSTYILARGAESNNPQIRLASLHLLAQRQTNATDELIKKAITCQDPLVRLEAIALLAQKKHPAAVGQAEALMIKLPPVTWFIFAEIYATIGDARSIRQLRRLMNHEDSTARLAAILATAHHHRDDLLPQIRQLATHSDPSQQEACAAALGELRDQGSLDRLKTLAESKHRNVSLAASLSLYQLGQHTYGDKIMKMASEGNVVAIGALGKIEGSEDLLAELTLVNNPHAQINATLALLERRDGRCLLGLCHVLLRDKRDVTYVKAVSHGKTLSAWKAVPTASVEDTPIALALSTQMREEALKAALELPEADFLALADVLLETQQNDLVPLTVVALENLDNDQAIALLKRHQQKIGAPLVRNYCNLALFRLGIEGPYQEALQRWVSEQSHVDLIRFRPMVPSETAPGQTPYELTPEETSKLFVTAVEALASRQDDHGVGVLLDLIRDGNDKNRYAIAGLLIRAIQ